MRLIFGDLQQTLRDEPRLLVENILDHLASIKHMGSLPGFKP